MNNNLLESQKRKKDEFYTLYKDIKYELDHYKEFFNNKVIYLNCDDGHKSNFFRYFVRNFYIFKLKKLICTGFTLTAKKSGAFIYEGGKYIYVKTNTGDFRNNIDYILESDIVVTNPPFSLFREYMDFLYKYNKKFIIWGATHCLTYKEIFPYFSNNNLYIGYIANKRKSFETPYDNKIIDIKNVTVFTNLKIDKNIPFLCLTEKYTPDKYVEYDNYKAINIDKVESIPKDFSGVMGVPITFLAKYNNKQFDIVGFRKGTDGIDLRYFKNGKKIEPFCRVLIRKKECIV